MRNPVQLNEQMNQQLSHEVTVIPSTTPGVTENKGKRNFTAAQMWYMQRNVRTADRIHRRIPR
jgi:hypothetical protein